MDSALFTDEMRPVYVARQRYILSHALKANVKDGKAWYGVAKDISDDIASRTGVPGIVVRRVLSKISPRNKWEATPFQAEALIRQGMAAKIGTTDKLKGLAYQMVEDHDLHLFNFNQAPKTWCFTETMDKPTVRLVHTGKFSRRPFVVPVVVCDRHTICSFGLPFTPNGKGPNSQITILQYIYLSDIMDTVADEFGYLPQDAQAIGWLEWRQGRVPDWLTLGGCFA